MCPASVLALRLTLVAFLQDGVVCLACLDNLVHLQETATFSSKKMSPKTYVSRPQNAHVLCKRYDTNRYIVEYAGTFDMPDFLQGVYQSVLADLDLEFMIQSLGRRL